MLHSRSEFSSPLADAPVSTTKDASSPGACSSGRYQQHPTAVQQQQHTAAGTAGAAASQQQFHQHSNKNRHQQQQQQQLRAPPVRYAANTSNLVSMSRAGTLPQHTAYQKWSSRGHPVDETTCTCVLPRTSVLCRLLVAMTILLVFIQAVSCGMFFCVTLPVSHSRGSYVDYQELASDISAPLFAPSKQQAPLLQAQQPQQLKAVPKLIPRVIHQTYRNGRLPASSKAFVRTWAEVNGDNWQVRFYSDEAALTFVRREFPEYFEAYLNLPKDVERADFFRYMVVLRLGGAYADVDAECRQPLDSIIQPADTLLVGWDTEVANATSAAATGLARQRLIASWFFVAAAGHPVLRELCDHIARNAMNTFSNNTVRDTAERTGQGIWTDIVLRHALQHQAAKHDDPWKVRILARVAFGVRPVGDDAALRPDTPGVVVLHHFMSSWQTERHRRLMQALRPLLSWGRSSQAQDIAEPVVPSNITHYPVSVAFNPPFTLMTDLVGVGDAQAAADISAVITAHGTWQPGIAPYRKPAVVEALVGALAKHSQRRANTPMAGQASSLSAAAESGSSRQQAEGVSKASSSEAAAAEPAGKAAADGSEEQSGSSGGSAGGSGSHRAARSPGPVQGGVLIDVGAGQGFFSLAAAARGHRVIAFEASPASLAAFRASIEYNGFQGLITVHSAALGASAGAVCLQAAETPRCQPTATPRQGAASLRGHNNGSRSNSSRNAESQQLQEQLLQARLRRRRGYPWVADGAALSPNHTCCVAAGARLQLSSVLQNATEAAVLRISAHGHEGFVLQGAMDYLRTVHKPDVVYLEFWPAAMRAAGYSQPVKVLHDLYELGYSDIAHAGRVCDERWHNATQPLHLQGSYTPGARMALQQPTWCKLRPEQFDVLANAAGASLPENVMFLLGPGVAPHPASPNSSSGSNSNSSTTGSRTGVTAHGSSSSSSSSKAQSISSGLVGAPMPAMQVHQTLDSSGPTAAPVHDAHTISSPSLALQASSEAGSSLQPQPL